MKKIILAIFAIIIIASVTYRILQKQAEPIVYSGTIEATLVDISAQLTSKVAEVIVKEGEIVEEGAPLLKLSCEDINVLVDQAKLDWNRAQKLRRDGSLSQESYEHTQSKFQELKVRQSWCDLHSPLKGTVISTYREKGEVVLPGQKLLTIADLTNLWCYLYLSASEMKLVSLGKEFVAYLPQLDKKIKVKVIHINSVAEFTPKNVQTREEKERLVYGVKIALEKSDLKIYPEIYPGMNLEVKIEN